MAATSEELVMVAVPRRLVTKVYGFIASQEEADETGGPAAQAEAQPGQDEIETSPPVSVDGTGWPQEMIERDYNESPPSMKTILKLMASRPNEELTTEDFADAIGERSTSKVAGALGAYGNRTKNRYRMPNWHFEANWNDDRSMVIYKMPPGVAEVIAGL